MGARKKLERQMAKMPHETAVMESPVVIVDDRTTHLETLHSTIRGLQEQLKEQDYLANAADKLIADRNAAWKERDALRAQAVSLENENKQLQDELADQVMAMSDEAITRYTLIKGDDPVVVAQRMRKDLDHVIEVSRLRAALKESLRMYCGMPTECARIRAIAGIKENK